MLAHRRTYGDTGNDSVGAIATVTCWYGDGIGNSLNVASVVDIKHFVVERRCRIESDGACFRTRVLPFGKIRSRGDDGSRSG